MIQDNVEGIITVLITTPGINVINKEEGGGERETDVMFNHYI